mgnify:CR=1 FL=1
MTISSYDRRKSRENDHDNAGHQAGAGGIYTTSQGSRKENGMPVFEQLDDEQLLKIRHYIRREAEKALAAQ